MGALLVHPQSKQSSLTDGQRSGGGWAVSSSVPDVSCPLGSQSFVIEEEIETGFGKEFTR